MKENKEKLRTARLGVLRPLEVIEKIKANNKYVNFEFTLFVHISLIVIIINITTAILIPQNAS